MSKLSRTKGHSFERDVARRLHPIFPDARRQLEYQEGLGIDLTNTGNLAIQCKRYKKYVNPSMIEEVPEGDHIPVLITQADRKKPIACLYLDDLIKILADVGEAYE